MKSKKISHFFVMGLIGIAVLSVILSSRVFALEDGPKLDIETVNVDTTAPVIVFEPIKDVQIQKSLVVKGKVSKEVTIDFALGRGMLDNIKPSKVAGLKVASSENNLKDFVHIVWEKGKEPDLDKYVIYREDVGIIDVNSVETNYFRDLKINSDTEYVYYIAALDASGNIGDKSEPLRIKTLSGDRKNIPKPIAQKATIEADRPIRSTKTSNAFEEEIQLSSDGDYHLVVTATDSAGNKAVYRKNFALDTKGPKIESVIPNGGFIYEYAANSVKIEGITTPNVDVKLYIDKNNLQKLIESYSTKSDADGRFVFNKVNLLNYFRGNLQPSEVNPTEFDRGTNDINNRDLSNQGTVEVIINATDKFGRSDAKKIRYRIGTCWSGNMTWDVRVLSEYQSPTFLSTERLSEGTETIYFYLNFSYLGEYEDLGARIQGLQIANACDSLTESDPRYNLSCKILRNACVTKSSSNKRTWYVACRLNAVEEMERWVKADWKSFMKAIHNEMAFPFRLRISYTERKPTQEPNLPNEDSRQVQTTCDQVSYVVDSSKIDPRDVLPDFLLDGSIKWLDSSVKALDKVSGYVKSVLQFVGVGCVTSIIFKFGTVVVRETTCNMEAIKDLTPVPAQTDLPNVNPDNPVGVIPKDLRCPLTKEERNKLTNEELKEKCPSCAAQWDFEAKLYPVYRGLCDRVFCHTAPAKWTEGVSDEDLTKKAFDIKTQCGAKDESLQGQPLLERSCSAWAEGDLAKDTITAESAGDNCYQVQIVRTDNNKNTKFGMVFVKAKQTEQTQKYTDAGVYRFIAVSKVPESASFSTIKTDEIYAKEFKGKFMTSRTDMCADVCSKKGYKKSACGDSNDAINLENPGIKDEDKAKRNNAFKNLFKGQIPDTLSTFKTQRVGYTADCMFGNYDAGKSVMDKSPTKEYADALLNRNEKELPHETECICVNEDKTDLSRYYTKEDVNPKTGSPLFTESEKIGDYPPFDYRYYKIGYKATLPENVDMIAVKEDGIIEHNKYNPNRYVEGRDQYACFGQNDLIAGALGKKESVLTLDPFRSHTAAFQCGCISGINSRINTVKNLMSAMQNCLISVKETGTADAGVCKELFTQHVCGLVWRSISLFTNQCNPDSSEPNAEGNIPGIKTFLSQGIKAIGTASDETQNEIQNEYGNARLTNLIGVGEEGISRKICLAAFGYDWNLDFDNIISASYTTPYSTLVMPVTKSREFLTYDPKTYSAKYEYRASWLINPGCDIQDYDVYLSCVTRKEMETYNGIDCSKQDDDTGNCGCIDANLDKEQTIKFYDGRKLAQGTLENRDRHDVISSQYKFDHLKFVLRVDNRIQGARNVRPGQPVSGLASKCLPEGHEDGVFYFPLKDRSAKDLKVCYVDANTGTIACPQADLFFGQSVSAYFVDENMKLNEISLGVANRPRTGPIEVPVGTPIKITPSVWKAQGKDVCLHIYSPENKQIDFMYGINYIGKYDYPEIYLAEGQITRNRLEFVDGTEYELVNDKLGAGAIAPDADVSAVVIFRDIDGVGINLGDNSKDKIYFSDIRAFSGIEPEKDGIEIGKYRQSAEHVKRMNSLGIEGEAGVIVYRQDLQKNEMFILVRTVALPGAGTSNTPLTYVEKTFRYLPENRAGQEERYTLNLDLVHLKPDAEFFTGPEDCNKDDIVEYQDSDKAARRSYSVRIVREKGKPLDSLAATSKIEQLKNAKELAIVLGIDKSKTDSAKSIQEIISLAPKPENVDTAKKLVDFYDGIIATDKTIALAYVKKAEALEFLIGNVNSLSKEKMTSDAIFAYERAMILDSQYFVEKLPSGSFENSNLRLQAGLNIIGFNRNKKESNDDYIKKFQKSLGLNADGKVGPKTSGEINRIMNELKNLGVLGNTANVNFAHGKDYLVVYVMYSGDSALAIQLIEESAGETLLVERVKTDSNYEIYVSPNVKLVYKKDKGDFFLEGNDATPLQIPENKPVQIYVVPKVKVAEKPEQEVLDEYHGDYTYFDEKNDNEIKFTPMVYTVAQKFRIDTLIPKAFIQQESKWYPNAISSCGAVGLMQLMPCTAAELSCFAGEGVDTKSYLDEYCYDNNDAYNCIVNSKRVNSGKDPIAEKLKDPELNVNCGIEFIKKIMDKGNRDIKSIAQRYNPGNDAYPDIIYNNYNLLRVKERESVT